MSPLASGLRPFLPALLVALFAVWSGSLLGGAGAVATIVGQLALLAAAAGSLSSSLDPLGLGRRGRWIPIGLWLALIASCWVSPVSRSGRVVIVLLPAFFSVPAFVERCLASGRRQGRLALTAVVGLVATWSLVGLVAGLSERAAVPLGHHLLLATWLVVLLPVGLESLAVDRRSAWLAGTVLVVALAALVATRSVGGWVGVAVVALVGLTGRRRWMTLGIAGIGLLGFGLPRILSGLTAGGDASLAARFVYWAGAWRGFVERPLLGWGPGSSPWLLPRWIRPEPAISLAGEVVGDPHSLGLQLLFEIGLLGTAMAGMLVWWLLRSTRSAPAEAAHGRFARAALAGAMATLVVGPTLGTTAVWVALGAAIARPRMAPPGATGRGFSRVGLVYGLLAAAVLAPVDLAHLRYEAARGADDPVLAEARLGDAVHFDPSFPLYRFRRGLVTADPAMAAERLRAAAEGADGVSALWLAAGTKGVAIEASWSDEVLARACRLDPLWAPAPWLLAAGENRPEVAARLGARAVVADPRLMAAPGWASSPTVLSRATETIRRWRGIDAGWRVAAADTLEVVAALADPGPTVRLVYGIDAEASTALSLHAFRRQAWPADLVTIPLDAGRLEQIDLPPAFSLPTTGREAVPDTCP